MTVLRSDGCRYARWLRQQSQAADAESTVYEAADSLFKKCIL